MAVNIVLFFAGAIASAALTVMFGPFIEQITARYLGGLIPEANTSLRGRWSATYEYDSGGKLKAVVELIQLNQIGRVVYGHNIDDGHGSRNAVRLHVDGDWVTGTWRNIAPAARHHGVLQLRILANGRTMKGRWLGFDSEAMIQEGSWTWERYI